MGETGLAGAGSDGHGTIALAQAARHTTDAADIATRAETSPGWGRLVVGETGGASGDAPGQALFVGAGLFAGVGDGAVEARLGELDEHEVGQRSSRPG